MEHFVGGVSACACVCVKRNAASKGISCTKGLFEDGMGHGDGVRRVRSETGDGKECLAWRKWGCCGIV